MRSRSRLPGGTRALALALALAPWAAPSGARAEDAASSGRADPEPSIPAEQIVIVGRRPRDLAGRDPTAAATVVEADRFAGEAKGVAELVATAPGVAVNDYGGLGRIATASIRGSSADAVLVLACGAGVQTAADAIDKPVFPGLESVFIGNVIRHGVFEERCQMCGDCVLDKTAGICPVTQSS